MGWFSFGPATGAGRDARRASVRGTARKYTRFRARKQAGRGLFRTRLMERYAACRTAGRADYGPEPAPKARGRLAELRARAARGTGR